jgi:hypothetical protein
MLVASGYFVDTYIVEGSKNEVKCKLPYGHWQGKSLFTCFNSNNSSFSYTNELMSPESFLPFNHN